VITTNGTYPWSFVTQTFRNAKQVKVAKLSKISHILIQEEIVVCPFVLFLLAIVLFFLLRFTDSDYPFGIFNLFLYQNMAYLRKFRHLDLFSVTECLSLNTGVNSKG
jgi:hypothetical protein